jgi:hypothetical protein
MSRLLPASAIPVSTAAPAPPPGLPAGVRKRIRLIGGPPKVGGRFKVERTFAWKDPIDVVGQGFALPAATAPSQGVGVLKKAGFDAGAGETLTTPAGDSRIQIDVLKFNSAKGATDVRDWLHQQDQLQPCFATCSESVSNLRLPVIPGALAAKQVPLKNRPPNAPGPFDHYAVEFTKGAYLYVGTASGGPGTIKPSLFETGSRAFYDHVKGL